MFRAIHRAIRILDLEYEKTKFSYEDAMLHIQFTICCKKMLVNNPRESLDKLEKMYLTFWLEISETSIYPAFNYCAPSLKLPDLLLSSDNTGLCIS